jgi:hypothetical protein
VYLAQFFVSLDPEDFPRIATGIGTPLEALERATYGAIGR